MRNDKVILDLIKNYKFEKAQNKIKEIYFKNNLDLYYYYNALIFCAQRNYYKAIELFNCCEKTGFKSDLLYYNMGVAFMEIKNLSEAEKYFKKSINNNNCLTDAYQNLAHLYIRRGDIHRAYRILKTCTSINSNDRLLSIEKSLLNQILKIS